MIIRSNADRTQRGAEAAPKSGTKKAEPASKKAKTASASGADKKGDDETAAKAEEEKKNEAPASAKPSTGGGKVLKLGDKLPALKLKTNEGKEVDVGSLAGDKGVVLFLYPKVG